MQFSKTSPLKSGESSEKSSGENRVKSCHVCGCHGFFGPDKVFEISCWGVTVTEVLKISNSKATPEGLPQETKTPPPQKAKKN